MSAIDGFTFHETVRGTVYIGFEKIVFPKRRNTFTLLAYAQVWDDGYIKGSGLRLLNVDLQAIAILPSTSLAKLGSQLS
ncbi:hypothetical protein PRIO_6686 [Paenibacillus riograndensis SBR5]|uniref:Uncharacterized protein n=1 Tax=Paenibacillus riograndensis SBR5 TaxID=1073571 RepID=A0A0E3WJM2_9BACL|nr:hypothetical protein PRIO_6686 [Paenibacillus riograndensis SBR5]